MHVSRPLRRWGLLVLLKCPRPSWQRMRAQGRFSYDKEWNDRLCPDHIDWNNSQRRRHSWWWHHHPNNNDILWLWNRARRIYLKLYCDLLRALPLPHQLQQAKHGQGKGRKNPHLIRLHNPDHLSTCHRIRIRSHPTSHVADCDNHHHADVNSIDHVLYSHAWGRETLPRGKQGDTWKLNWTFESIERGPKD